MNNSLRRSIPWLAVFGVMLVVSVIFDLVFFSDCSFAFQINALLVLLVPLTLLESSVGWLFWFGRSLIGATRSKATVRSLMIALALLAGILGTARWWVQYNFATVYATGYREEDFRRVKIGMNAAEVESIMVPPIRKDSTSQRWSPLENWIYSEPPPHGTLGDNYWRRWVMFDRGKVVAIVDDYYVD